ncbi:AraC family transcriptional regulator [Undibacter mobilis]|uniref:AraC family transcriptional regulator n=1 Tax=Undibacter mobilis TaxID=2292256 RepID=A0A371BCH7_9BRAD|nr:helix-turn-helix transcriptional regulator [Undibacter mobilis]RDV05296.1 AraC family transcriptional regulator [Undibacter mobilis]
MADAIPIYRPTRDNAPRPVAVLARTCAATDHIPLHIHRRGQLLHATSGIMRVETGQAAWILPPARAIWLPPQLPHKVTMRSKVEMRTVYIDEALCAALPGRPVFAAISGLLRELILALLEEPADYGEHERGGAIARLILTELGRLEERRYDVPMPRDDRALRVARALLDDPSIDRDLDRWADEAGASRRTLARLFRHETGLGFAEWRARLRAVDGLARLSGGQSVAETAAAVGYASASAFSAMIRRTLGNPPRQLVYHLSEH